MDEKGYFKFGGSTVVLLFEPNRIRFCEDLVTNSRTGRETLVKVGQPLATAIVPGS
jgi:phosphatidylserine decarboxylase